MPQFPSVPFWHDHRINYRQGAKACPLTFLFGGGNPTSHSFQASLADAGIMSVAMVYVDNADSPAPTVITIAGTRQRISIPANQQGYYRVLGSPMALDFTIQNAGGGAAFVVNLHWLNIIACEGHSWPTQ